MRKLEDIIASLTESITFEAYNHVDEGEISGVRAACTEALRRALPAEVAANDLNELVTIHALNRVLYHLSEDNYRAPSEGRADMMWRSLYQGRAAARVIVRHRIRICQPYDAILWQQMKDGE